MRYGYCCYRSSRRCPSRFLLHSIGSLSPLSLATHNSGGALDRAEPPLPLSSKERAEEERAAADRRTQRRSRRPERAEEEQSRRCPSRRTSSLKRRSAKRTSPAEEEPLPRTIFFLEACPANEPAFADR
jgi:hypothetical protein